MELDDFCFEGLGLRGQSVAGKERDLVGGYSVAASTDFEHRLGGELVKGERVEVGYGVKEEICVG